MINLHASGLIEYICNSIPEYKNSLDSTWAHLPPLRNSFTRLLMSCWCNYPVLIPLPNLPSLPEFGVQVILSQYALVYMSKDEVCKCSLWIGKCKKCGRMFIANAIGDE